MAKPTPATPTRPARELLIESASFELDPDVGEEVAEEPLVEEDETGEDETDGVKKIQKDSVFGEAEADVTAW